MPDEAVIDASVAFKLVLPEEHSAVAAMLMFTLARDGVERIAPPFFPFEVTNGLYRRVLEGTLTPATAAPTLHDPRYPAEERTRHLHMEPHHDDGKQNPTDHRAG